MPQIHAIVALPGLTLGEVVQSCSPAELDWILDSIIARASTGKPVDNLLFNLVKRTVMEINFSNTSSALQSMFALLAELQRLVTSPLEKLKKTAKTRCRLSLLYLLKEILERVDGLEEAFQATTIRMAAPMVYSLATDWPHGSYGTAPNFTASAAKIYHRGPLIIESSGKDAKTVSLIMPAAGRSSRYPGMKPKVGADTYPYVQPAALTLFDTLYSGCSHSRTDV